MALSQWESGNGYSWMGGDARAQFPLWWKNVPMCPTIMLKNNDNSVE